MAQDTQQTLADRIAELEIELRQRDDKIKELTRDRDEANELVDRMREQVDDADRLIHQWIDVFEMERGENGDWLFDPVQSELWERHNELWKQHQALNREWNKLVPRYNAAVAPRPIGRPLAASAAQEAVVLKQRKAGASLRTIAAATGLSLNTVRTIVSRGKGTGRTAARRNEMRRKEFAKHRAAAFRAREKARASLPAAINERLKEGEALVKAAKGLGR